MALSAVWSKVRGSIPATIMIGYLTYNLLMSLTVLSFFELFSIIGIPFFLQMDEDLYSAYQRDYLRYYNRPSASNPWDYSPSAVNPPTFWARRLMRRSPVQVTATCNVAEHLTAAPIQVYIKVDASKIK